MCPNSRDTAERQPHRGKLTLIILLRGMAILATNFLCVVIIVTLEIQMTTAKMKGLTGTKPSFPKGGDESTPADVRMSHMMTDDVIEDSQDDVGPAQTKRKSWQKIRSNDESTQDDVKIVPGRRRSWKKNENNDVLKSMTTENGVVILMKKNDDTMSASGKKKHFKDDVAHASVGEKKKDDALNQAIRENDDVMQAVTKLKLGIDVMGTAKNKIHVEGKKNKEDRKSILPKKDTNTLKEAANKKISDVTRAMTKSKNPTKKNKINDVRKPVTQLKSHDAAKKTSHKDVKKPTMQFNNDSAMNIKTEPEKNAVPGDPNKSKRREQPLESVEELTQLMNVNARTTENEEKKNEVTMAKKNEVTMTKKHDATVGKKNDVSMGQKLSRRRREYEQYSTVSDYFSGYTFSMPSNYYNTFTSINTYPIFNYTYTGSGTTNPPAINTYTATNLPSTNTATNPPSTNAINLPLINTTIAASNSTSTASSFTTTTSQQPLKTTTIFQRPTCPAPDPEDCRIPRDANRGCVTQSHFLRHRDNTTGYLLFTMLKAASSSVRACAIKCAAYVECKLVRRSSAQGRCELYSLDPTEMREVRTVTCSAPDACLVRSCSCCAESWLGR